jgi:lactoylglutathione lyase
MKTLQAAYRVADLGVSLDFYKAVGYTLVGSIDIGDGASITVLKFPGEAVGTLELIHRPADGPVDIGNGFSHLVIQIDDIVADLEAISKAGLSPGPVRQPIGQEGPQVSWLTDPDGRQIELVQWPPGHPDGVTAADFDQWTHH